MTARPRPIVVDIDEMVLHGVPENHGQAVAAALRTELASSLIGWHPGAAASIEHLDAGAVTRPALGAPDALGRAVARRIRHALPGATAPVARRGVAD
jgi:hypothetical protein